MIKFSHVIFYVKDVLKTLDFYKEAFGLEPKFIHESNGYAELQTGAAALAFVCEEAIPMILPNGCQRNHPDALPQACEIVFTSADPEKTYNEAVEKGATALYPPEQKPWGQLVGYVRDPNGILIEIAGEMAHCPQAT